MPLAAPNHAAVRLTRPAMRHDIHRQALRAAAHVALALPLLEACTRMPPPPPRAPELETATPPAAPAPAEPATHASADDPTPARECTDVLDEAFPQPSDFRADAPAEPQRMSFVVEACCVEMLGNLDGQGAAHRWDCCANLPAAAMNDAIGIACTPWGPPVPPAMPGARVRGRLT